MEKDKQEKEKVFCIDCEHLESAGKNEQGHEQYKCGEPNNKIVSWYSKDSGRALNPAQRNKHNECVDYKKKKVVNSAKSKQTTTK